MLPALMTQPVVPRKPLLRLAFLALLAYAAGTGIWVAWTVTPDHAAAKQETRRVVRVVVIQLGVTPVPDHTTVKQGGHPSPPPVITHPPAATPSSKTGPPSTSDDQRINLGPTSTTLVPGILPPPPLPDDGSIVSSSTTSTSLPLPCVTLPGSQECLPTDLSQSASSVTAPQTPTEESGPPSS